MGQGSDITCTLKLGGKGQSRCRCFYGKLWQVVDKTRFSQKRQKPGIRRL